MAENDYRDQLILENRGLARQMAQKFAGRLPSQVDKTDLEDVAIVALVKSAGRYRPQSGVPFLAFARRRMKGAMLDFLRGLDWCPRSARKIGRDMQVPLQKLWQELGREPTREELAERLGLTETRLNEVLYLLDSRTLEPPSQETMEELFVAGPEYDPSLSLRSDDQRRMVRSILASLPSRERQIIRMYYAEDLSHAEIGERLGVGESRISQLRTRAVTAMRSAAENLRLPPRDRKIKEEPPVFPVPILAIEEEPEVSPQERRRLIMEAVARTGSLELPENILRTLAKNGIAGAGALLRLSSAEFADRVHHKTRHAVAAHLIGQGIWLADGEERTRALAVPTGRRAKPAEAVLPVVRRPARRKDLARHPRTAALAPKDGMISRMASNLTSALANAMQAGHVQVETIETTLRIKSGDTRYRLDLRLAQEIRES